MEVTFFAIPVILAGLFASDDKILTAFLICFLFGGTAALSLPGLGGAPILPAILLLPFLLWRAINDKTLKTRLRLFAYPNAGFWLTLLILYEVLSAYFLPRIFAGETLVYTANRGAFSGVRLLPLIPVSTNLTQSIYTVFGLLSFFSTCILLNSEKRIEYFIDGVLLLASLNILAALIQIGESYLGFPSILTLVRNADYAMFGNYEVGGLLRIQGTFPETSGFSGFTLPLFAFTFSLFRNNYKKVYSGTISLLLLIFLLISTSTTAYFGLGSYFIFIFLSTIALTMMNRIKPKIGIITYTIWLCLVLMCIFFLFNQEFLTRIIDFFNLTVFNKLDSSSGKERGAWNAQGLTNLIETYGFGVGFGSNRSSSLIVAFLSNTGIFGTVLFAIFMLKTATTLTKNQFLYLQTATAAKNALLIASISTIASAAFAEPGMMFYCFAAVVAVTGKTEAREIKTPTTDFHSKI